MPRVLETVLKSRAARNTFASYISFASVAVCGLLTIPVAVHYLSKEQIGLWAVANAIISYLMWMDLGVGDAIGRKIADAVSANDRQEINRWWTATQAVLWVQGGVVICVGIAIVPFFIRYFSISSDLASDALLLFLGALAVTGLGFPLRAVPGLLVAQHRAHLSSLGIAIVAWIRLGVFLLILHLGWGLVSYLVAIGVNQVFLWLYYSVLVKTGECPPRWDRGGFELARFRSLFSFSLSLSVMGILDGLLRTLPPIILGRMGGLALVPVWTFTMNLPMMLTSLVNRTIWAFYPGLLRLQVSGQKELLSKRHKTLAGLILPLASLIGAVVVALNSMVVQLLAGPDFYAGNLVNAFFAAAVVAEPVTHLFRCMLHLSGSMGKAVLVAVVNLLGCVAAAVVGYRFFGMPGLAFACLLVPVAMGVYGYCHGARKCGFGPGDLSVGVVRYAVVVVSLVILAGWWLNGLPPSEICFTVFGRMLRPPPAEVLLVTGAAATLAAISLALSFLSLRNSPDMRL